MTKINLPPLVQPAPRDLAAPSGVASSGLAAQATARSAATPSGPGPSRPTPPPDLAKIAKSAQDFEAMAIDQLLQPMFDTVDTAHDTFGGGDGEEAWKPMMVQEIAKNIAANGGLGLAKPVYDAMLRMQEAKSK